MKKLAENAFYLGSFWSIVFLGIAWTIWCFLPDYVSLFKTRIFLIVLKNTKPNVRSLVFCALIDLFVGIFVFIMSTAILVVTVTLLAMTYVSPGGFSDLVHRLGVASILAAMFIGASLGSLVPSGHLFIDFPMANLFWASLFPSIWLWGYIAASLLTRFLISAKPTLRFSLRHLDVENHPLRSVGVVAATMACIVSLVILSVI